MTRAENLFRSYIKNLRPGRRIHWDDMDRWAAANFPSDREMVTVGCMGICAEMANEGCLVRAELNKSRFHLDDYFRTENAVLRARKVTAAVERRVEMQFRQFVMALSPGAVIEWFDMDFWVYANFPDLDWDAQGDLNVVCMVVGGQLELEGWLAFKYPGFKNKYETRGLADYYYRTDKTLQPWE
jgi:hypothetical protein